MINPTDALFDALGRWGVRSMRPDLRRQLATELHGIAVTAADVDAIGAELRDMRGLQPAEVAAQLAAALVRPAEVIHAAIADLQECARARAPSPAAPAPGAPLRTPLELVRQQSDPTASPEEISRRHVDRAIWCGVFHDRRKLAELAAIYGVTLVAARDAYNRHADANGKARLP